MKESQSDPKKLGEHPEMHRLSEHPEAQRLTAHPEQAELPPYEEDESAAVPPEMREVPATSDAEETHGVFRNAGWVALALLAILVAATLIFRPSINNETRLAAVTNGVTLSYPTSNIDGVLILDSIVPVNAVPVATQNAVTRGVVAASDVAATPSAVVVYLFDTDKSVVPETASLTNVARQVAKNGKTVVIKAYTDETGRAAYNKRLSERRAKAIGDYMVAHGVPATKVRAKGYGPTHAYTNNAQDRRAEITVE